MKKIIHFLKEYGVLTGILVLPVLFIVYRIIFGAQVSSRKQVHEHFPISYNICGSSQPFQETQTHGLVHGHKDNQIHLEGVIDTENRKSTLGDYFTSISVPFSKDKIGTYTNGDICNNTGEPGTLQVKINGIDNFNYEKYILQENDSVEIIFK